MPDKSLHRSAKKAYHMACTTFFRNFTTNIFFRNSKYTEIIAAKTSNWHLLSYFFVNYPQNSKKNFGDFFVIFLVILKWVNTSVYSFCSADSPLYEVVCS